MAEQLKNLEGVKQRYQRNQTNKQSEKEKRNGLLCSLFSERVVELTVQLEKKMRVKLEAMESQGAREKEQKISVSVTEQERGSFPQEEEGGKETAVEDSQFRERMKGQEDYLMK